MHQCINLMDPHADPHLSIHDQVHVTRYTWAAEAMIGEDSEQGIIFAALAPQQGTSYLLITYRNYQTPSFADHVRTQIRIIHQ